MDFNLRNCEEADRLIQKALDGTLIAQERDILDKHMAACPACAAAWEEHRELARLATAWARRPAASDRGAQDFTAAVLAQISQRREPSPGRAVSPLAIRLGIAGFAVLIAVSCYFLTPLVPPLWAAPRIPTLRPDTPAAIWTSLAESARALPADAVSAWNGLLSEHVSYYPALAAVCLALSLALILALQAQRPRRRLQ